jgi:cytochrome bd-type quinol oxidase subunit 2
VTPLYPQKLALTSPTGGGRSVGIVRSRAEAMEFSFLVVVVVVVVVLVVFYNHFSIMMEEEEEEEVGVSYVDKDDL